MTATSRLAQPITASEYTTGTLVSLISLSRWRIRNTGEYCRELFNKKYGHKEWVTSLQYLPDGRLLSAGMDFMLCLWDKSIVKCESLFGHKGSISKVMVDQFGIGVSASYDASLIAWDLTTLSNARMMAGPHKNPILDFAWRNSLVVSGDKTGFVALWDINTAQSFHSIRAHDGPVSNIHLFSDGVHQNLICTAGVQDGVLNIMDMRTNEVIHHKQTHGGAINAIRSNLDGMSTLLPPFDSFKAFKVI